MKSYLLPVFSVVALAIGTGALIANAPPLGSSSPAPTVAAAPSTNAAPATNATPAATVPPDAANPALAALNAPPKAAPALPKPVEDVLRLSKSSVGDAVVVSFIGTLQEPFTLNADQIIYLSDLGMDTTVLNALLGKAASSPAATAVAEAAPAPAPAPGATIPANVVPPAPAAPSVPLAQVVPGGPEPQAPAPVYGAPQVPAGTPVTTVAPGATMATDGFYSDLSPYGTWVQVEPYGMCWQPTVTVVNTGWQPYCDGGSWMWTDYGWYWHSTYTWGWAPFHYGRWHRASHLGWVWCPGRDWGPAWVAWRHTDAHCGWAPLPPECHWSVGVGYSWRSRGTSVSVGFGLVDDCWLAVSWGNFCAPSLAPHRLRHHDMAPFIRDSRAIYSGDKSVNIVGNNNTVIINNGVTREQVQAHSRAEIRKVAVTEVGSPAAAAQRSGDRPGAAGPTVGVYRPNLNANLRGTAPGAASLGIASPAVRPGASVAGGGTPSVPSGPGARMTPGTPGAPGSAVVQVPPRGERPVPMDRPSAPNAGPSSPSVPSSPAIRSSTPSPAPRNPVVGNPGPSAPAPVAPVPGGTIRPGAGSPTPGRPAPSINPNAGVSAPVPARPEPIAIRQDPAVLRQPPTFRNEPRKPEAPVAANPVQQYPALREPGMAYNGGAYASAPGAAVRPASPYAPAAAPSPAVQSPLQNAAPAQPQFQQPAPAFRPETRMPSYPVAAPAPAVQRPYVAPQAPPAAAPVYSRPAAPAFNGNQGGNGGGGRAPNPVQNHGRSQAN